MVLSYFSSVLFQGENYDLLLHSLGKDDLAMFRSFLSLSIEIEVKETTCAENHTCDEKQTESLPVSYSLQSEDLGHGNVPEQLKNQRHKKNSYDHETHDESHAKLLAA